MMTVIFDFDNTLFDTLAFKQASAEAVAAFGPSMQQYMDAYTETIDASGRPYGYDPERHFALLRESFASEADRTEAKAAMDSVLRKCAMFVFPGVTEMLDSLRDKGVRLALLTLGSEAWQRQKIAHTGIGKQFDVVRVVEDEKIGALGELSDGGKVVVVNDNGRELDLMYTALPSYHYVCKKGPHPGPSSAPVRECDSIEEVARAVAEILSLG